MIYLNGKLKQFPNKEFQENQIFSKKLSSLNLPFFLLQSE